MIETHKIPELNYLTIINHYLKQNKMQTNKQIYLDKIPMNALEHITQLLLRFYSKTTLTTLNRALRSTEVALYTSELKNTSVADLHKACISALDILKSDSAD